MNLSGTPGGSSCDLTRIIVTDDSSGDALRRYMTSAILGGILAAAFVLRWWPRLKLPHAIGSDAYFHLTMARTIRENGYRIPPEVPRVLVCRPYTYPYLFHWLLSFVPDRFLMVAERIISPFLDTCYVLLTFVFVYRITASAGLSRDPTEAALWSAAFVALCPAFLTVGPGPRAYGATPRTLGQLLFLVYLGSVTLFMSTQQWLWLVPGALAVACLSITTKFGNQVVVFIASGLALAGYEAPIAMAVCGYVLAVVATRGKVLRVLHGQIAHSIFYFKYLQKPFLYPDRQRLLSYLRRLLSHGLRAIRRPVRFLRWYFSEPYLLHALMVNFPHMLVGVVLLGLAYARGDSLISSGVFAFMVTTIAISFILSWLISLKPLMFLGEAGRYAEHTIMAQVMVFVLLVQSMDLRALLWLVLGYSVLSYWFSLENFVRIYADSACLRQVLPLLVEKIDTDGTRIFWLGHVFWPLLFFTKRASILIHGANFGEHLLTKEEWFEVFGNFPFPGRPLREIVARYNIQYVVGTQAGVEHYEKLLKDSSFSERRFPKLASAGDIAVFATGKCVST
jgi:hypothetical protein